MLPQGIPLRPRPVLIADMTSNWDARAASPSPTPNITMPRERSWSASPPGRQIDSVASRIVSATPFALFRGTPSAYGLVSGRAVKSILLSENHAIAWQRSAPPTPLPREASAWRAPSRASQ
uniref:Uncharacterized protein n=1 Tax=Mycobacterium kansasii TaxID=1768 RepID=A0A653F6X5_MYCKA|nr:hypothetical protein BIN_B_05205 [Mycobacterium kansasii]